MNSKRSTSEAWEMEQLREKHISEVPDRILTFIRTYIESEVVQEYPVSEVETIFATGSWVRGEAIAGVSDLDLVVMVDPSKVFGPVGGTRHYFKVDCMAQCPYPFSFYDVWIEPGPPKDEQVEL